VAVVSQGCRPRSSSSLGGHHPHNNLWFSEPPGTRDISRCGNGNKWPSCAGPGQEVLDKGEWCQWKSLEWDAPTLRPLSCSHQSASRARGSKQCHLQNVSVPAVAAGSQDVSGILDALNNQAQTANAHTLRALRVAIFISTLPSCFVAVWGCFGTCSVFSWKLNFRKGVHIIQDPSLLGTEVHKEVKLVASIDCRRADINASVHGEEGLRVCQPSHACCGGR